MPTEDKTHTSLSFLTPQINHLKSSPLEYLLRLDLKKALLILTRNKSHTLSGHHYYQSKSGKTKLKEVRQLRKKIQVNIYIYT